MKKRTNSHGRKCSSCECSSASHRSRSNEHRCSRAPSAPIVGQQRRQSTLTTCRVCGRQLLARHLPYVRRLPRQMVLCLQPKFPLSHARDVGRRLTAVQSARSYRMCGEGARGCVTYKQSAGIRSLTWHPSGLWTSSATVMQSASQCPLPGEVSAVSVRQRWPFDGTSDPANAATARIVGSFSQRRLR